MSCCPSSYWFDHMQGGDDEADSTFGFSGEQAWALD